MFDGDTWINPGAMAEMETLVAGPTPARER